MPDRAVRAIEEVARRARSAVAMSNGVGSDCLVATLVSGWLRTLGVERELGGRIACQLRISESMLARTVDYGRGEVPA